ncbi:globin family protein [Siphonobacter aquaeclarae]|uniref:Nitrogen regulatory protein P-II n=1 Tax=Siphonobacter aquaeclarae TaxID=563176 RepID=A0A1G9YUA1_9BACT|nr:hypothetical protein [Siphonobacter aquaeclarae]SDN12690.1 hypothetical protein SAMN04488090_5041 [Siphonobacter aquaeclarae]
MKLLIVTAIAECRNVVGVVFERRGIRKYSIVPISGVSLEETRQLTDNWFGGPSGVDRFESVMLFCFTEEGIADAVLSELEHFNQEEKPDFPVRGLVLPVERSI